MDAKTDNAISDSDAFAASWDEPQKSALSQAELDKLTDDLIEALKTVYDPEIPVDIYELGLIYKVDVSDDRETPARPLATALQDLGAQVAFHDPHVPAWDVPGTRRVDDDGLADAVASADLVVLVQRHAAYDLPALAASARRFFDTTGTLPGATTL